MAAYTLEVEIGQIGAVCGSRATGQPAAGCVATKAEVAAEVCVLVGDCQGRLEQRVAEGVGFHACFPTCADGNFDGIVDLVTVRAIVGSDDGCEVFSAA